MRIALSLVLAAAAFAAAALADVPPGRWPVVKLDVPVLTRAGDRTGPASLAMVLAYYGADSAKVARAEKAAAVPNVEPEKLAESARAAGFHARVATPGIDSLATFLRAGVPPIVAVETKFGGVARTRYMVVSRFDTLGTRFFVQSGSRRTAVEWFALNANWTPGGGRAVIVTRP